MNSTLNDHRDLLARFLEQLPVDGKALLKAYPHMNDEERDLVRTCVSLCAYEMTLRQQVASGLAEQRRGLDALANALNSRREVVERPALKAG